MEINLVELVDHLIDLDPYDLPPTSDTDDETPPPPAGEDTKDSNAMKPKLLDGEESLGGNEPWMGRRNQERNLLSTKT